MKCTLSLFVRGCVFLCRLQPSTRERGRHTVREACVVWVLLCACDPFRDV
jgi:hypothetical protein